MALSASCWCQPASLRQLAFAQAMLCMLVVILHLFGKPLSQSLICATVAGAVLLPVFTVYLGRSNLTTWIHQLAWVRWGTASGPKPRVPEAVQAILASCGAGDPGRKRGASASTAPSPDGLYREDDDPVAAATFSAGTATGCGVSSPRGTSIPPINRSSLNRVLGATAAAAADGATTSGVVYAPRSGFRSSETGNTTAHAPPPLQAGASAGPPRKSAAPSPSRPAYSPSSSPSPSSSLLPLPSPGPGGKVTPRSAQLSSRMGIAVSVGGLGGGGVGSLKAPVGLSRCTIVEDAPFPPPNTQVVMELHEKTLRVGSRRLRYRGYRPADRIVQLLPAADQSPAPLPAAAAAAGAAAAADAGLPAPSLTHIAASPSVKPHAATPTVPHRLAVPPPPPTAVAAVASAETHAYGLPYSHTAQHRLSLSIKVPWSQPSALPRGGGGLLESLNEALASGSGYMVVGAAVRPGCILLQVDLMATSETCAEMLRGVTAATVAGIGGAAAARRRRGEDSGDGDDGGQLAARLAQHVGIVAPPPPDGGEVLVSLGGGSSFAFSYDALTAEWSASQLEWTAEGVAGAGPGVSCSQATLLWRLQSPYGVRMRSSVAATVVPPAACSSTAGATDPTHLELTVVLDAPDEEAARYLAEQLRPLLLLAPTSAECQRQQQQAQQQHEQAQHPQPVLPHGAVEGCYLVANCAGRSLPVSVLRVVGPSLDISSLTAAGAPTSLEQTDPPGPHSGPTAATATGPHTLSLALDIVGTREALEAVGCRLAVLSLELWYDSREVTNVPVVLVHEQVALPPRLAFRSCAEPSLVAGGGIGGGDVIAVAANLQAPAAASLEDDAAPSVARAAGDAEKMAGEEGWGKVVLPSGGEGPSDDGGDSVARALAAELAELLTAAAAAAAADGEAEGAQMDEQSVRQMFVDLAFLELYVASQVRLSAGLAANADSLAAGDDREDSSLAQACASPVSWCSDAAASPTCDDMMDELRTAAAPAAQVGLERVAETPPPPAPPPLLPGSLDLSSQLQQLLARDDARQRHCVLLTGANLLSYTVLHAMPYTAKAVQEGLAALGCGLAEADELTAAAAGGGAEEPCGAGAVGDADDGMFGAAIGSRHSTGGTGIVVGGDDGDGGGSSGDGRVDEIDWQDEDEQGLPLVHLAVLSGSLRVVQMVLRWAAAEGLGADWVLRCHRGRTPLQLAAVAAAASSTGHEGNVDGRGSGGEGGPGGGGTSGPQVSYLDQVKQLLPVEQRDDVSSDQEIALAPINSALMSAATDPDLEGLEELLATLGRPPSPDQSSCGAGGGDGGVGSRVTCSTVGTALAGDRTVVAASTAPTGTARMLDPQVCVVRTGEKRVSWARDGAVAGVSIDGGCDADIAFFEPAAASSAAVLDHGRQLDVAGGSAGCNTSGSPSGWRSRRRRRNPLLECVLGYEDPAVEERFRRFVLPYDVHVVSYWVPLMCFLLSSAHLRQLRGGGDGDVGSGAAADVPAAVFFSLPYFLMAGGLLLRPSLVHRHLPAWWLLCGAARLVVKWPLGCQGLLSKLPSLTRYMPRGAALMTDILLPGLCERVPGPAGVWLRLLDAAALCQLLVHTGVSASPAAAVLHALGSAGLSLATSLAVEWRHRARFEAAIATAGGGATPAPPCADKLDTVVCGGRPPVS